MIWNVIIIANMRIYLTVPYKDKDIAKKRNVRYCMIYKKSYIDDPMHIDLFMRWNPQILTEKGFQNLESVQTVR